MSKLWKYLVGIAGLLVAGFLVWRFSDIVVYILVAAVLAIIGKPMAAAIRRVRIKQFTVPRWVAATITVAAMWAVAILFFRFFIPLIFGKLSELANLDLQYILDSFREPLETFQQWLVRTFSIKDPEFSLMGQLSGLLPEAPGVEWLKTTLSSAVDIVTGTFVALFSITFIAFYFLKEDGLFEQMVVSLFPAKYESNVKHAIDSATGLLIRYFTGILAESALLFLMISVAFLLWGFDAETAFFMGFVAGVLNVIPYVGPIMIAVICVIVGVLSPIGNYSMAAMVAITLGTEMFIQLIDNFVLQPYLYSRRVKSHPLEIFIVILVAGSIGGVVGMLIAIPSYTVIRVFAKEFFSRYRLVRELTKKMD